MCVSLSPQMIGCYSSPKNLLFVADKEHCREPCRLKCRQQVAVWCPAPPERCIYNTGPALKSQIAVEERAEQLKQPEKEEVCCEIVS